MDKKMFTLMLKGVLKNTLVCAHLFQNFHMVPTIYD